MFSKALIFALLALANANVLLNRGYYGASNLIAGGIPVYRSSANYGGLYAANGYGYGANLGRVAGLGALRTSGAIIGGGALGYGTGGLIAGGPLGVSTGLISGVPALTSGIVSGGVSSLLPVGGVAVQPALSTVAVQPAVSQVALGGLGYGSYGSLGAVGYTGADLGNLNVARGISVSQAGPVNAAVQTISRTVDYRPVPYTGEAPVVQDVDVPPQESPLRINFQSKSSPLQLTQQHIPAEPGQVQVTQSEDEPQTAIHNVVRPVIQRVNELVQPYRTLTQTVEPVIEQTHTNIAQGEGVRLSGLTSGIVGGTGVLAASGIGYAQNAGIAVAQPALAVAQPALAVAQPALAVAQPALAVRQGLAVAAPTIALGGYGYRSAIAAPALAYGGYRSAIAAPALAYGGYRTAVAAPAGVVGLGLGSSLYGAGLHGASLYGSGLYGAGYRTLGVNSGLYGSGLGLTGLSGLSGLSGYGTTARIARFGAY